MQPTINEYACAPVPSTPTCNLNQFCQCEEFDESYEGICNPQTDNDNSEICGKHAQSNKVSASTMLSRNIIQNKTSEVNVKNLEQLKEYAYDCEYRQSPKSCKPIIVYICRHEGCGKEFLRTWNLLDHVRMHRGVQPFVCHFCSKSFTQRGNLKKHVYRHNNPALESRRRYTCKLCSSRFTERYNYKVRLATIALSQPY